MTLTQKEKLLLQDLKTEEQLCVDKYKKYAETAHDGHLQQLFTEIGQTEQQHLNTINTMLQGETPQMNASGNKQAKKQPAQNMSGYTAKARSKDKQQDCYLCNDTLATEKHVSALYDTSVFEFAQPPLRNALNHIQSEEQHHGEQIYNYMSESGMV